MTNLTLYGGDQGGDFRRLAESLTRAISTDHWRKSGFNLPRNCESMTVSTDFVDSLAHLESCVLWSNVSRESDFASYAKVTEIYDWNDPDDAYHSNPKGSPANDPLIKQEPSAVSGNDTNVFKLADFSVEGSKHEREAASKFPAQAVEMLHLLCDKIQCDDVLDAAAVKQLRDANRPGSTVGDIIKPYCAADHMLISDDVLSWEGVQDCSRRVCAAVGKQITDDPDIGGIGVCISYTMEILFVIIIAVYITMTAHRRHSRSHAAEYHERHGNTSSQSYRKFVRACTRFQKAQCWFIGALAIAAFTRQPAESIGVLDQYMLTNITLNGIVMISFTAVILFYLEGTLVSKNRTIGDSLRHSSKNDGSGRISWFVFGHTIGAFVLCGGFMLYELLIFNTTTVGWLNASSGLCRDGLIEQRFLPVLQFVNTSADIPLIVYAGALAATGIVMIFLTIRQISPNCGLWRTTIGRFLRTPPSRTLFTLFILILYSVLIALQLHLLYLFFQYVDPSNFGFGQVVATLVWAPCIIDYLQDVFEGKKQLVTNFKRPSIFNKPSTGNTFYIKDEASTTTTLNRPPTASTIDTLTIHPGEDEEPGRGLSRSGCGVNPKTKLSFVVNVKEKATETLEAGNAPKKKMRPFPDWWESSPHASGPPKCVIC